jgi:hypothetical protein
MKKPAQSVTKKDVIYALQFGGERLLRTHCHDERLRGGTHYTLSKTGLPVRPDIATFILSDPHVVPCNDGLFPEHSQQFEWQEPRP